MTLSSEQDSLEAADSGKISQILFGKTSNPEDESNVEQIKPWGTGLEFSTNIRETIRDHVNPKISDLKRNFPLFANLDEAVLQKAIVDNVLVEIDTSDPELELLLLRAGDSVKRAETDLYIEFLKNASPDVLAKLNLNPNLRDLTVDVLGVAVNANSVFIDFMEFAHNTPDPPKTANPTSFYLSNDDQLKTFVSVFSDPSRILAEGFDQVLENAHVWENEPNGLVFKEYLTTLASLYKETDPQKAEEVQKQVEAQYGNLLGTDFPVVLTPGLLGYFKEPYMDPELKVSIVTPDTIPEQKLYFQARNAMADSLSTIGEGEFQDHLSQAPVKCTVSVGGFGVNLKFPTPAQARPSIIVYLNEQYWQYDQKFPVDIQKVTNADEVFKNAPDSEKDDLIKFMCRMNTVLHELGHNVHPSTSEESKRLGSGRPYTIVNEVKADILYRALVPEIISKGGLPGTREQWAVAMLASSLQEIDNEETDPYHNAAAYPTYGLIEAGAITRDGDKYTIVNFDKYYDILKQQAVNLLTLYKDPQSDEQKVVIWLDQNIQSKSENKVA